MKIISAVLLVAIQANIKFGLNNLIVPLLFGAVFLVFSLTFCLSNLNIYL